METLDSKELLLQDGRRVYIRRAGNSDVEGFLSFINGLSPRSRDFMHGWSKIADEQRHARKLAAKTEDETHYALVVVADDPDGECVIGYCWVDGLKGTDVPMLGIGIADGYHEAGIGKFLLRTMLAHMASLGVPYVRLGVWEDNPRAMHVYERVGFNIDPSKLPEVFDRRIQIYMIVETRKAF